jgi:hypothetical protein
MSLSNPTLTNPAQHFFKWAGSIGKLQWWDKENEKNVEVRLPFEFIVLDQLGTITGYNKAAKTGFWSNEVRNTRKEEFTVRSKGGVVYTGFYKNEQGIVQVPKGAEYAQSIYIAHKIGDEWVIGNIKASGSARSAWFDFTKAHAVDTGKITMEKGEAQTAQTGDFYPPVFKWHKWTPEEYEAAVALDKELQIYLSQYLSAPKEDDEPAADDNFDDVGKATPEQIADYEDRKAKKKAPAEDPGEPLPTPPPDDVVDDFNEDDPINLDDIPF